MFYPSVGEHGEIVYHKGAHLIYHKKVIKGKRMSMWDRLWKEIEMSMEVASFIEEAVYENKKFEKFTEIHLDINPDEKWESNKLLSAGVGMLAGMGYKVLVKPDSWVAMCCADMLVR